MRTLGRLRYFVATAGRRLGAAAGAPVGLFYVLAGLVHRETALSVPPDELFRAVVVTPLLSGDPLPWLAVLGPAAVAGVAVAAGEAVGLVEAPEGLPTPAARSLLWALPVSTALGVLAVGAGQVTLLLVEAYLELPLFGVLGLVVVYLQVVVADVFVVALAVAIYATMGCAAAGAGYLLVRSVARSFDRADAESAG